MNAFMYAQADQLTDPLARGLGAALAPVVAVVVIAVVGFGAAMWANRRRPYEPPSPEEQPRPPEHATHLEESREPDEDFGAEDGHRILPHEMKGYGNFGSHTSHGERPADDENSGGASASGRPGG
ncbi:DUF6479 family protein [Streptomyces maoxianensis]|uniref:DUF6479 family protein n=1 Tax=Streptomyces maoxianensis TaxID=1459942 RepID=A0ABV9G7C6_9ACTN